MSDDVKFGLAIGAAIGLFLAQKSKLQRLQQMIEAAEKGQYQVQPGFRLT